MTPAERIAAALRKFAEAWPENWVSELADDALDALCPRGERVVLDRTGDTDRLIRQERKLVNASAAAVVCEIIGIPAPPTVDEVVWVDSPEGGE